MSTSSTPGQPGKRTSRRPAGKTRSSKTGRRDPAAGAESSPADEPPQPLTWIRPKQFIKELAGLGLSIGEKTRLAVMMRDHAAGHSGPKDHTKLDRGVEELRLSGDRRVIRLYFGRVDDGTVVLVAVHVKVKKVKNDVPGKNLAARRLREYKNGTWGRA